MKNIKQFIAVFLTVGLFGIVFTVNAQMHMKDKNAMYIIKRLETNTDQFRDNLDIERVYTDNENLTETVLEARVAGFELRTDELRDRLEDNEVIAPDIETILSRALAIEQSLQNVKISSQASADWMRIKSNLDDLSKNYNVAWVWTLNANPYWKNPRAVEDTIDTLEDRTDEFRRSFDFALDVSSLNGTETEDKASNIADNFEDQVDRWEDLSDDERLSSINVKSLLQKAMLLDDFIRTTNLSTRTERDWAQVKSTLDELAWMTSLEWKWNATPIAIK